ncbi:MAG: hypothetical protein K0R90_829 [Oscillospiraceae bacterium]|jgi:flavin reductase (DIM6/NTAB) family NADH-FMN oxidoreductase RutF|nr:hypothetical protein [Oscillospiraceae bacterium]
MAKIKWKAGTLLAPVPPVMISCGTMEKSNIMTVAWTGILNTDPPKTYISVRPTRHSHEIIKNSREFVINLTTASLIKAADFCGIRTGEKVNKFDHLKLVKQQATEISCPMIAQSPVSIECKVTEIVPMGSHDMFIADIVAVNVEEKYIDESGKLRLEQCSLAAYAHGAYFGLGKKIGSFGFSVKKKRKKNPNYKPRNK